MGDAGPSTPAPGRESRNILETFQDEDLSLREVNILVTGFGVCLNRRPDPVLKKCPSNHYTYTKQVFKTFATNPSFLIASCLPKTIDPTESAKATASIGRTFLHQPTHAPNTVPYRIRIHIHPEPVRVAYSTTAIDIPKLIARGPPGRTSAAPPEEQHATYDYVLHIGMAAGRDNYTLETRAHRDHYKIKDIDDRDGFISGEYEWKRQNLPEVLDVGWHKEDVLARWQQLTTQAEDELEPQLQHEHQDRATAATTQIPSSLEHDRHQNTQRILTPTGRSTRSEVKLSKDAGRYLCEFILYTSLAFRYRESPNPNPKSHSTGSGSSSKSESEAEPSKERVGKVAFLHVPGGTSAQDIARGTLVAKAAITAFITSWEEGYRNEEIYQKM